jgi:hypothetical protein
MFVVPQFRINLKPLVSTQGVGEIDTRKVLQSVQREILKAIRDEIQKSAFSTRAKRALAKGVGTKISANSVRIIAKHPAFYPLLEGQKRAQMSWLTKAKRPIPIILDNGELIFRNATPRSMARGRWYHPGRQPTTIIDKARNSARAIIKRRLSKELHRKLRAAMRTR